MSNVTGSNWREQIVAEYKDLKDRDQAAKREGKLEGRYIQEQIADGHAYYRIVEVRAQTVMVEHMNIGDAWTIPMIESMGHELPLKYAEENINFRDELAEIFANNKLTIKEF